MKWIILLVLLLLVAAMIAVRYRRHIQTAIYVWRMFGKMRQAGKSGREIEQKESVKDAALVRCARCGTWVPQNRALNLRSGIFYCSKTCLETTANVV